MKHYRAEVWVGNTRVYCSDWLDDHDDARQLMRDTVQMYKDEGTSNVQGLIRHAKEAQP